MHKDQRIQDSTKYNTKSFILIPYYVQLSVTGRKEKKKKKETYLNKKGGRQPYRLRKDRQRKENDRPTKGGRDRRWRSH